MMGKFDLAIKEYDEAIRIKPDRFDAVQNRAMSNFYLKNYDKTWEDVRRLERNGIFLPAGLMESLKKLSGRDS